MNPKRMSLALFLSAILAVGLFIRLFHGNCVGTTPTMVAQQDLEVIKNAILLCEQREATAFRGNDLHPLVGKYLQIIPSDGWGKKYLFDRQLGLLASFGKDGKPGGIGDDQDVYALLPPVSSQDYPSPPGVRERLRVLFQRQVKENAEALPPSFLNPKPELLSVTTGRHPPKN
jgi:hypothetical protein